MRRSQNHPDVPSWQPDPQHRSQDLNLESQNTEEGVAELMEKETGLVSS